MDYEQLFARAGDGTARVGLIGAGAFGASLLARARRVERLQVLAICDRELENCHAACRATGIPAADVAECENVSQALEAVGARKLVVTADSAVLMEMPLDMVVEATGVREVHASARARAASPMRYHNERCALGASALPGEYDRIATSEDAVRRLRAALH